MAAVKQTHLGISFKGWVLRGFMLIGLLYCLVPAGTKGSSFGDVLRGCISVAIVLVTAALYRPRISRSNAWRLTCFFVFSLFAAFHTTSGYSLIFGCAVVFGVILATAASQNSGFRKHLASTILALLLASVLGLIIQLAVYIYNGTVLDVHALVYPHSESRVFEGIGLVRLTSFYTEPGTYANWVYLLLLIYTVLSPKVKRYLIFTVAASMIVALSAWGTVVALLLFGVTIFGNVGRGALRPSLAVALIASLVIVGLFVPLDAVLETLASKTTMDDASVDSKIVTYTEFYRTFGQFLIFGDGFSSRFCEFCLSPQDAGFALSLSVVMGVLFTVWVLCSYFIALLREGELRLAVLSLPLMFTKAFYWDFAVWMLFFLVVTRRFSTGQRSYFRRQASSSTLPLIKDTVSTIGATAPRRCGSSRNYYGVGVVDE